MGEVSSMSDGGPPKDQVKFLGSAIRHIRRASYEIDRSRLARLDVSAESEKMLNADEAPRHAESLLQTVVASFTNGSDTPPETAS